MSDTPSIYKSVLGLNETGGTFLAYPFLSKYVWTTTTISILLGVQPNQDRQKLSKRCEDFRPSTTVFIFDISSNRLFRMGINPAFPNNPRILKTNVTQTQHTPHSNSVATNRKSTREQFPKY